MSRGIFGVLFLALMLSGLGLLLPACDNSRPPVSSAPHVSAPPCGSFGDATVEANSGVETDEIHGNPFSFAGGRINSLSAYTSGTGNFRMALYADNGSGTGPGTLLLETGSQAVTGTGWNTIDVVPAMSLASGTYWIAQNNDGTATINYFYTGAKMINLNIAYGAFPSSISTSDVCDCSIISLKANYCP